MKQQTRAINTPGGFQSPRASNKFPQILTSLCYEILALAAAVIASGLAFVLGGAVVVETESMSAATHLDLA
jgi:hypothetical protein